MSAPAWLRSYLSDNDALYRTHRISSRVLRYSIPAFVIAAAVDHFTHRIGWLPILIAVIGGLAFVAWATLWGMRWWTLGPARWGWFAPRARKVHLRDVYLSAAADALDSDVWLVRVLDVTYVGPHGTRAVVEHRDGARQDAWFWHTRPRRGRVYAVQGSGGPRASAPTKNRVLYVGDEQTGPGVLYGIPTAAWRQRPRRRTVRFE